MLQYQLDLKNSSHTRAVVPDQLQQQLPFRLEHCGHFFTEDQYFTKRDGLNNFLLLITTNGQGQLTYQGATCLLKAGSGVVIDCRKYHEYRTCAGHNWDFYYLHFQGLCWDGYRVLTDQLVVTMLSDFNTACTQMEELYDCLEQHTLYSYHLQSHLISCLLMQMIESAFHRQNGLAQKQDMKQLAGYIRGHCQQNLTIDDFMEHTGLSRYYLIHAFTKQMGISPMQYLHRCRIRQAEALLSNTNRSVEQIADLIGYATSTLFIRHFKQAHQTTPTAYRKAQNAREKE